MAEFRAGGTGFVDITFRDEDDNLVVPNSATWTLTNENGRIINGRQAVAIAALAEEITIVLFGDDLIGGRQIIHICGRYDSTEANDLPFRDWHIIDVKQPVYECA